MYSFKIIYKKVSFHDIEYGLIGKRESNNEKFGCNNEPISDFISCQQLLHFSAEVTQLLLDVVFSLYRNE